MEKRKAEEQPNLEDRRVTQPASMTTDEDQERTRNRKGDSGGQV